MILRLPKWAQAKLHEHLKNLERQGRIMPTFKDIVKFSNDRADVANHPFFMSFSTEAKPSKKSDLDDKSRPYRVTTLRTSGTKEKDKT